MVQVNFALREINCKIVYYGPGMSGKTTNLVQIHNRAPDEHKGNLTSITTEGERTLFFDFLPLDIGTINGMKTKFQLYTVPGQVYYNSTRKLVLQGVDGVIFVADSQRKKMKENMESLKNLETNLSEYGFNIKDIPLIIQFNKRDLPDIVDITEMNMALNAFNAPTLESIANTGKGVIQTFKTMASIVLERLNKKAKESTLIGNVDNNNVDNNIVADIDNEKIKWTDFKRYCQIQSRLSGKGKDTIKLIKEDEKRLLGSFINYNLLLQEASKRNLEAKDSEIERQLKEFIAKHGS
ncbi:MAG: SurA N-terminal domain-containing protein, partial [Nitrospinae bacterium]|nr:SurA N-terminal domain-containing protein [Nitrospinota bacterium]